MRNVEISGKNALEPNPPIVAERTTTNRRRRNRMSAVAGIAGNAASTASMPEEMRKLILKLRWIGLDEEAERLSATLARIAPSACSFMGPRDTD
jgi:hypothetical protein